MPSDKNNIWQNWYLMNKFLIIENSDWKAFWLKGTLFKQEFWLNWILIKIILTSWHLNFLIRFKRHCKKKHSLIIEYCKYYRMWMYFRQSKSLERQHHSKFPHQQMLDRHLGQKPNLDNLLIICRFVLCLNDVF